MRLAVTTFVLTVAAPAAASLVAHAAGVPTALSGLIAALPDPATAALLFGGLGLVAGARRGRSIEVAD